MAVYHMINGLLFMAGDVTVDTKVVISSIRCNVRTQSRRQKQVRMGLLFMQRHELFKSICSNRSLSYWQNEMTYDSVTTVLGINRSARRDCRPIHHQFGVALLADLCINEHTARGSAVQSVGDGTMRHRCEWKIAHI